MTTPSRRILVTLPAPIAERFDGFCRKHPRLSVSAAMKLLVIEGLDAHATVSGEPPIARVLCGCDPELTCAAAFNRKFDGRCRLAPTGDPT